MKFGRWLLTIACCYPIAAHADDFPKFDSQVIDPHVGEVCYGVMAADVNGDGKLDIVAVSENSVLWYENPSWQKRVVIRDATDRDNVCIAAEDIDGDGKVDFALGSGWPRGEGTITWLSRGNSLDEAWQIHRIGGEPSLHRMRFADVLGAGRPQLVISPLNKSHGPGVQVTAFEIPEHPATDRWPPTILDQTLDRMHNHCHVDWDDDHRIDTLTASAEGIHVIRKVNESWVKNRIAVGNVGETIESQGAGEIKVGRLANNRKFIATIEPMHGNQVVIYAAESIAPRTDQNLKRNVIDDSLKRGHALWAADIDNDHIDELIVGHSDAGDGPIKGPGMYIYHSTGPDGAIWEKHVLDDGGIATEDALAADFNGDGWIDVLAGGRATRNLKLYLNRGLPSR